MQKYEEKLEQPKFSSIHTEKEDSSISVILLMQIEHHSFGGDANHQETTTLITIFFSGIKTEDSKFGIY